MTKNATSNNSDPHDPGKDSSGTRKYTFSKSERIYRKKVFGHLFDGSASFYLGRLWVIYSFTVPDELVSAPSMVAFSVPKRRYKRANKRNLLKRRMKEAYRLNKHLLLEPLEEQNRHIAFLVKYNSREIHTFQDIEKDFVRVLKKLRKEI